MLLLSRVALAGRRDKVVVNTTFLGRRFWAEGVGPRLHPPGTWLHAVQIGGPPPSRLAAAHGGSTAQHCRSRAHIGPIWASIVGPAAYTGPKTGAAGRLGGRGWKEARKVREGPATAGGGGGGALQAPHLRSGSGEKWHSRKTDTQTSEN